MPAVKAGACWLLMKTNQENIPSVNNLWALVSRKLFTHISLIYI